MRRAFGVRRFVLLACAVPAMCALGAACAVEKDTPAARAAAPAAEKTLTAAEKPVTAGLLDLNTATKEELMALPGIGEAYSQNIIEGRPYARKDELKTLGILPESVYEKIADKVIARQGPGVPEAERLDLNTATKKELMALPGVGEAYAQRIIDGRPYARKDELTARGILPESVYEKIAGYVIARRKEKAK